MKTKLLSISLFTFSFFLSPCISQVPQGFNYQAIARDASGNAIVNQALPVRITIQSDSLGGTTFWIEEHPTVITNGFGLFTLILGNGTRQANSTVATFNDIDWKGTPIFIKTEISYNGWKNMGSSRLWAVPYSMIAGDLGGPVKKLAVAGQTTDMEEALFEVKNKNGQTVFAVYNEGVRIYVDDGIAKSSTKGGFAIGGFSTVKGTPQNYFVVNADSIRAYIDTNPSKSSKGGFAIGGFAPLKAPYQELFRVTQDSTRIYFNDTGSKGTKGGFAIGGFSAVKGIRNDYLLIKPDSTNFYVRQVSPAISSTFNLIAINQSQIQKSLLQANTDTVGISGVMNVQNNLIVNGNINVGGTLNIVSDIDGNTYKTVTIGTQVWMKENLKTTKYNDGTAIPLETDNTAWSGLTSPAFCWNNNDLASYKTTYGALYNWWVMDAASNGGKNVCPTGWHVPTDGEWTTLVTYSGGDVIAGGKLKESGTSHWGIPNTGGTNEKDFTALPGGYRYYDGTFTSGGQDGYWWSSTANDPSIAFSRNMFYLNTLVGRNFDYKITGCSVRCVKD